jgi:hypothetical protein
MHQEIRNYIEELLSNQPCPIDTWIHLQSCLKCSQELEALRKVSGLLPHRSFELEPNSLFYARVQARVVHLRLQSPWHAFLDSDWANRLGLTGLACLSLFAIYLFGLTFKENQMPAGVRPIDVTLLEPDNSPAQRDAVLVNLIVDSRSIDNSPR